MRQTARLFTQVQLVPHLFSRTGVAGPNPWRRKVELVKILQIVGLQMSDFQSAI
jgi:hypothetical protein